MTGRQMQLSEILLNPSVKAKDEKRLRGQALEIKGLLELGPVKTSELAAIGCQYNARVNEVRHFLFHKGKMVDEIEGEGGENKYKIVNLEVSTFWKQVKAKNEEWKWAK